MDSAVQRLRKGIKIEAKFGDSSEPQVEALNVAYRSQDPKRAQEVVRSVVSALDQTNDTLGKRDEIESDWLKSQIKQLERQFTGPQCEQFRSFACFAGSVRRRSRNRSVHVDFGNRQSERQAISA